MKYILAIMLTLSCFGQSQRMIRRYTGPGAPGSVLGSGYGDIYIRSSNSTVYICTKLVGACIGVSAGNWVSTASSPTTTLGDLIRRGTSADERLAVGGEGAILGSISGVPAYSNPTNVKMDSSYLYSVTPSVGDNTTKTATTAFVKAEFDDRTLAFVAGDAYKVGRVNSAGTTTEWMYPPSKVAPITFSYPGSTIVTGWCQTRHLPRGGYLAGIHLKSFNPSDGTAITGSSNITFSTTADSGAESYTTIGSVALTATAQVNDVVLSGFTRSIAANRVLRACVTSATSVQHLVISPEIW